MNWDEYVFDGSGRDVGVAFNNRELYSLIEECFYYTWNAPDTYWASGQDPIPPSYITAPAVNTLSVENITATSATFKGELTDDGGSDKVNVYFLYQATPEGDYWDYYHPIERVPDPCIFQYTVENLQPNTEYVMVAQVSNEAERVRGTKIYFTTEGLPSPPPPENEQVSNGLFDGETNWTKVIVTSLTDPIDRAEVEATYDSTNSSDVGTGSVKVRASAYNYNATAHIEAYWEQSIGPISSGTTIAVNGDFSKSIVQSGANASIDTATVRIDVYDGTSWVTVVSNTDKSSYGWTPLPENTYTVTNEITKIRVYMDAAVYLGNGRNQEATVVLWMDNISLKT
jgi:hypothetical protein